MSAQQDTLPGEETAAIAVYCGAVCGNDSQWTESSISIARRLVEHDWHIVYGGAHVGLMGAVADSALEAGGSVHGIIPEWLIPFEGPHPRLAVHSVASMFERKRLFIRHSCATLVLPGGLGTLDEIFEIITLQGLGQYPHPVIIYDMKGYWQPLKTLIEHVEANGFLHHPPTITWAYNDDQVITALEQTIQPPERVY